MDAFVAGHDDATPALCRAIFPRRNDATRAGNDRDERYNVVWLDLSLHDQIDYDRRQHATGIAIAAIARQLHHVLYPSKSHALIGLHEQRACRVHHGVIDARAFPYM